MGTQHWIPLALISVFLGSSLLPQSTEAAGGDCMSGDVIECFECNTWEDDRCHDPFNFTIHEEDMPPLRACGGCCVKMVQFIGTEHYQIKRTCTDDFGVNFFMVNHACMTEGHRFGHMCFCEEHGCNSGDSLSTKSKGGLLSFSSIICSFLIYSQLVSIS